LRFENPLHCSAFRRPAHLLTSCVAAPTWRSSPAPCVRREDATRRAERLRAEQEAAASEASRREREAAELERALAAARAQAAEAERKREAVLEESRRLKEPSKRLNDEAEQ
jgi:hypothetical protein